MENLIKNFINCSYGDGYGNGDGYGYGDGSGNGYGYGNGDGYGDGYGDGNGYGYGNGDGSGNGYGYGDGYGNGDGYGDGYGYGYSYGYGNCNGDGSGYGDGNGDANKGIKSINGKTVYFIDEISTLIDHIHGNIAKGKILMNDLSTKDCYIVKQNDCFAHGDTLKEAMEALQEKLFEDMPEEERIEEFVKFHKTGEKYPNTDFFNWHNKLTGSCLAGRNAFVKNHEIDMDGSMTVSEFIELTKNDFGGDTILKLKEYYHELG